jgi:hypothetical protein
MRVRNVTFQSGDFANLVVRRAAAKATLRPARDAGDGSAMAASGDGLLWPPPAFVRPLVTTPAAASILRSTLLRTYCPSIALPTTLPIVRGGGSEGGGMSHVRGATCAHRIRASFCGRTRVVRPALAPRRVTTFINLNRIRSCHPLVHRARASDLGLNGGLALQRKGHRPGVVLVVRSGPFAGPIVLTSVEVRWRPVAAAANDVLDSRRITEDGAEAVALALVSRLYGWTVRRRLQQFESADWLLRDMNDNDVALEVSGINGQRQTRRINEKIDQVRKSVVAPNQAVCVVAFGPPAADVPTSQAQP